MRFQQLTGEEWKFIEPLLPPPARAAGVRRVQVPMDMESVLVVPVPDFKVPD